MLDNYKIVTIIGKSNTGISTLFNRIINKNISITLNKINTTRDNNYYLINWQNSS